MLRLPQQQLLLRSKLDRVYEDRLSDQIPEELWTAKSVELQQELRRVRTEMERHEIASQAYETAGLQILELARQRRAREAHSRKPPIPRMLRKIRTNRRV